jgi:methylthioribose-1-phosphate isomerase
VNLRWALERMRSVWMAPSAVDLAQRLEREAQQIEAEDRAANKAIGRHGAQLLPSGATVLTHCNTGSLATAGFGTALGVIWTAYQAGKIHKVLAAETRPYLQGARLTAWELKQEKIPFELITDNAAAHLMRTETIHAVLVGADRVAANGDVANKIGTYSLAVLAAHHRIPFYVAAPLSTIDMATSEGRNIPIEERSASEVTMIKGKRVAPPGVKARHPAFDVTPANLVTVIITERGIARPPYSDSLRTLFRGLVPESPAAERQAVAVF